MSTIAEHRSQQLNGILSGQVLRGLRALEEQDQYQFSLSDIAQIQVTTAYWNVYSFRSFAKAVAAMSQAQFDWFEFQGYIHDWKRSRKRISSFAKDLIYDQNYLNIIGMGDRGAPCIMRQLQIELKTGEPDHWFVALSSITKENPVPPESQGKIYEMAAAWLAWGKERGHLDAEIVGGAISKPR